MPTGVIQFNNRLNENNYDTIVIDVKTRKGSTCWPCASQLNKVISNMGRHLCLEGTIVLFALRQLSAISYDYRHKNREKSTQLQNERPRRCAVITYLLTKLKDI